MIILHISHTFGMKILKRACSDAAMMMPQMPMAVADPMQTAQQAVINQQAVLMVKTSPTQHSLHTTQ